MPLSDVTIEPRVMAPTPGPYDPFAKELCDLLANVEVARPGLGRSIACLLMGTKIRGKCEKVGKGKKIGAIGKTGGSGSATTFAIIVEFSPSKAKLSDGSVQEIYRDTTVRLDVELADVDPQELESMKEKAVCNLVERIGGSNVWGPEQEVSLQCFDNYYGEYVRIEDGKSMVAKIDQQEGWACKQVTFYAELIDLQTNSRVGYVSSKMAAQLEDDVWVSQKNMLALLTEPTVVDEDTGIDADGEEGTHGARKIVVDWNVVELNEKTDLFIAPISNIDMAEMFGIQVDDKDKEKDDSSLPADGNTGPGNANEDKEELMRMATDDVDDTNDIELVCLYDKENPVIEVGKLWASMVEFRMSFMTYAVKNEFKAKSMWTDRKKFYARCKGYDGGGNACKWRKRAKKAQPLVVKQCWPVKKARLNGFRRKRNITAETVIGEHELTETVTAEHEQNETVTAEHELIETVTAEHELTETVTESFLHALGQSKTIADEATVVLPCLEVVLPSVEHERTETVTQSALTAVLPCLEVVLPSVELQTEEVKQCVSSTQSTEVQTEEVGHGQVQKLRGPSGLVGKNTKSISINKLCAVEPNSGKKEKKSSGRKKQKK
ncbi:putative LRR receptor-like serine/threonine-protein kinase [Hordeum vulgare]|nr:putative LRR receptor-like serine/threonine-protein kinase [Hordeum vulgare]